MAGRDAPGARGPTGFLDRLEDRLSAGWRVLTSALRGPTLASVRSFATPGGGFRGRQGPADPYYTDFAIRLLDLAGVPPQEFGPTARYLAGLPPDTDLAHLFCRLYASRLLRRHGWEVPPPAGTARILARQRAPGGGYAHPGRREPSACMTFLAVLIGEITGEPIPDPERDAAAVLSLRRPGGGFGDGPGEGPAQANATAAAVATLTLRGASDPRTIEDSADFLARLQGPGGGIRPHPDAPGEDLLSTFTTLAALDSLNMMGRLRLAPLGRFVLGLRTPEGGFRSGPEDPGHDPEYTYYGVGSLCLLQAHLSGATPPADPPSPPQGS